MSQRQLSETDLKFFAYHISQIATQEGTTIFKCFNDMKPVNIFCKLVDGTWWHCEVDGVYVGNRMGAIREYTKIVFQNLPVVDPVGVQVCDNLVGF